MSNPIGHHGTNGSRRRPTKVGRRVGPAVGEALGEVRQQLRDFVAAELGMLRVEVELTQSALRELRETHDELKKQVELIRAIRRGDIFELPINNADDDAA